METADRISRQLSSATAPLEVLCHSDDALRRGFLDALETDGPTLLHAMRPSDVILEFAHSVVEGLQRPQRSLNCSYLYDARGSQIYEQITAQPEYYPTRTEAWILGRYAAEIRQRTGPVGLLELGAGSAIKTDQLLAAWTERLGQHDTDTLYVPVDVSSGALHSAGKRIQQKFPSVRMVGVHGSYDDGISLLGDAEPVMAMFMGSTIGNFAPPAFATFLGQIARQLGPKNSFLLGVDLVKDPRLLNAAYNDAAGWSSAFTLNMFERINRELGSEIDLDNLEHLASYSPEREQIEIQVQFRRRQEIRIAPLNQTLSIPAGERVLVEISRKFRLDTLLPRLAGLGLDADQVYTDDQNWFAVLLLRQARDHG